MKPFRLVVLLLVALLLPIRGTVAATMVCAEMGGTGRLVASAAHAHQGLHRAGAETAKGQHDDHAQAHAEHHAHGDQQGAADGATDGATGDTCHLCASGCGLAALLTAFPAPLLAPPAAPTRFPSVAVPPLDFQLDGQDRPPRTI